MKALVAVAVIGMGLGAASCGEQVKEAQPAASRPDPAGGRAGPYRAISIADYLKGAPEYADGQDAKAFLKAALDWANSKSDPSQSIAAMMAMEPRPSQDALKAAAKSLAAEGNELALILDASLEPDPAVRKQRLAPLVGKGNPLAVMVSAQEDLFSDDAERRAAAKAELREAASKSAFVGYSFGETLVESPDPKEAQEGAALLMAMHTAPSDVLARAASLLLRMTQASPETLTAARQMLEATVAATKVDQAKSLGYDERMAAAAARVELAGLLEKGIGGARDTPRAIVLYKDVLAFDYEDVAYNYQAHEALIRLGVLPVEEPETAAMEAAPQDFAEAPIAAPSPPPAPSSPPAPASFPSVGGSSWSGTFTMNGEDGSMTWTFKPDAVAAYSMRFQGATASEENDYRWRQDKDHVEWALDGEWLGSEDVFHATLAGDVLRGSGVVDGGVPIAFELHRQ